MSEKEVSAKEKRREAMEVGRFLGWLKRVEPEIYEELEAEAKEKGIPIHRLIADRLRFVQTLIHARGLSTEDLFQALYVWRELYTWAMESFLNIYEHFISRGLQSYVEVMKLINEELTREERLEKERRRREMAKILSPFLMAMASTMVPPEMRKVLFQTMLPAGTEAKKKPELIRIPAKGKTTSKA